MCHVDAGHSGRVNCGWAIYRGTRFQTETGEKSVAGPHKMCFTGGV